MNIAPTLERELTDNAPAGDVATVDHRSEDHPRQQARRTRTVLHVINGEHYSGAERVQDLLANCLPKLGYDVDFACLKQGKFAEARTSTAPIYHVPMRGKADLLAGWRLAHLVRRRGYDIIHTHTPRTAMIGRLASFLSGVPLVYHVHSPTSRDSTRGWHNRINAWVERFSIARAVRLIAVSGSLGRHMEAAGFSRQRVAVVPNGVPTLGELPRREQAPSSGGEWTLGTVALFRPRKGTEVLIDAIAKLRDRGVNARLRCIGGFETPEYEADLKRRVADLALQEHVHWVGFTQDVPGELAKLDLFALPSLFGEGLPMVVLEAMAAGVPVVATDVEGVPEAIRHGIDGVIAAAGDPTALAAGIEQFTSGNLDWQTVRETAHTRHAEMFSDRAMAAGVARVYDEIL